MTVFAVCSVRDRALDAFMQPLFVPAIGLALRSFSDEVNRPESPMFAHSDDYDLYEIGLYDDANGSLTSIEPRVLSRGKDVHRPDDRQGPHNGPQGRREGA